MTDNIDVLLIGPPKPVVVDGLTRAFNLVKFSDVTTAISALAPSTFTEVGSPPMSRKPAACGAAGSVMSTKPTAPWRASV